MEITDLFINDIWHYGKDQQLCDHGFYLFIYTHMYIPRLFFAIPEMLHNDTAALENRSHLINAKGTH